jgi:hypothetical protein
LSILNISCSTGPDAFRSLPGTEILYYSYLCSIFSDYKSLTSRATDIKNNIPTIIVVSTSLTLIVLNPSLLPVSFWSMLIPTGIPRATAGDIETAIYPVMINNVIPVIIPITAPIKYPAPVEGFALLISLSFIFFFEDLTLYNVSMPISKKTTISPDFFEE